MRAWLLLAGLAGLTACRISLATEEGGGDDGPVPPACMEATTYQDLPTITTKIFERHCTASGCHNGSQSSDEGRMDLRTNKSMIIIDRDSNLSPMHKIVVPGEPNKSYLMFMLGHIKGADMDPPADAPPDDVGFMPQDFPTLCLQKREAIERWIMEGADPSP